MASFMTGSAILAWYLEMRWKISEGDSECMHAADKLSHGARNEQRSDYWLQVWLIPTVADQVSPKDKLTGQPPHASRFLQLVSSRL